MAILLTWVGGEHEFALKLGQLRKLQETCNAGPEEILNRIRFGTWRVNDIIEPIRLGLIGSGALSSQEARDLLMPLVEQYPIVRFKLTANAIMADALFGNAEDPVGEEAGETAPPENGGSRPSMEAAP